MYRRMAVLFFVCAVAIPVFAQDLSNIQIHGFATQVLGTLGTTSGTDPDAALVDNDDVLLDEACADVLATAANSRLSSP